MAKGTNQKLKLLYLAEIFRRKTDENHGITLAEITRLLGDYDINADRKTLYQDFEELRTFGLEIESEKVGKTFEYRLLSREFELPELKLLVDAVQSSKFITENKSRKLITKLESLVSEYEAKQLHRDVIIAGRLKAENETIYINVDKIHSAINSDKQISFQYFQWTVKKKKEARHSGAIYTVSPWYLVWDDENYYLVAFDSSASKVKHFRVDKMLSITETNQKREGESELKGLNTADYSRQLFGMLGGTAEKIELDCENSMAGVIIDRFGRDTMMICKDSEHFTAHVTVIPSDQFIGWIIGLGGGVRITSPASVVERAKKLASDFAAGCEK